MVPSYVPSRIRLDGKRPLWQSLAKELVRSPGVYTTLAKDMTWVQTPIPDLPEL